MCKVAIALCKPRNALHARIAQVTKKQVHTHTSQIATAHLNLQLAIAHRKSCIDNFECKTVETNENDLFKSKPFSKL